MTGCNLCLCLIVFFCPRSPQSLPDVCEYKDACRGGEHNTHVPENPAKADQAPCSHQQEEQGKYDLTLPFIFDELQKVIIHSICHLK